MTLKEDPNGKDEHWIVTLYERYAKLYGDTIEQPITPKNESESDEHAAP